MRRVHWVPGWLWVATVVSAVFAVVVFRAAYAAEAGSRAGAEPVPAGLLFATVLLAPLVPVWTGLRPPASLTS